MSARVDKTFKQTRPLSATGAAKEPDAKRAKKSGTKTEASPAKGRGKGGKAQAAAAAYGLDDDEDFIEEILKGFDLNSKFGPCVGITRMERWERAEKLGLAPPENIKKLLTSSSSEYQQCLWEDRV